MGSTIAIIGANGYIGHRVAELFKSRPDAQIICVINKHKERAERLTGQNLVVTNDARSAIQQSNPLIFCLQTAILENAMAAYSDLLKGKEIFSCSSHISPQYIQKVTGCSVAAQFVPNALINGDLSYHLIPVAFSPNTAKEKKKEILQSLINIGNAFEVSLESIWHWERLASIMPAVFAQLIACASSESKINPKKAQLFLIEMMEGLGVLMKNISLEKILEMTGTVDGVKDGLRALDIPSAIKRMHSGLEDAL